MSVLSSVMALKKIRTTGTVWCQCLVATQAISGFINTYCCFCIISANADPVEKVLEFIIEIIIFREPLFLPGSVEHTLRNIAIDHWQEVCSVTSNCYLLSTPRALLWPGRGTCPFFRLVEKWKWKSLSRVWLSATHQNTGISSHSFFQGIFPTQGSNPDLPHYKRILYQLSHQGSPRIFKW